MVIAMKYTKININSARKNPKLNPKVSVIDELLPYKTNSRAFITYTTVNKVGINPSSTFNTPLGIYAYPLRSFWENIANDTVPFASGRPYVSLLLVKKNAKILNNNYSWNDNDQDQVKLYKFCEEKKLVKSNKGFVRLRDDAYEKYPFESRKPVFYIWALTRYIAYLLNPNEEDSISHITKWSSIFNKVLGYDGAIDFRGWGFIHPNEPKQAVFFTIKAFSDTKTFLNKRYEKRESFDPQKFKYSKFSVNHNLVDKIIEVNPSLGRKTFFASNIFARPVRYRGKVKVAIVQGSIEKGTIIDNCILGEPYTVNEFLIENDTSNKDYLKVGFTGSTAKNVKLINCTILSSPGTYLNTEFYNCVINGGYIGVVGEYRCTFNKCRFKKTSSRFTVNGYSFVDAWEYKVSPNTVQKLLNKLFEGKNNLNIEEIQKILDDFKERIKAVKVDLIPNEEGVNKILRNEPPLASRFQKRNP